MSRRSTFTPSEIATVAKYAQQGVYLAMVIHPDGTRVLVGLDEPGNDRAVVKPGDFSERIKAFARGETRCGRKVAEAALIDSPMTDAAIDARIDAFLAREPRRPRKGGPA